MIAIHLRPCDDGPRTASRRSASDLFAEAGRRIHVTLHLWRERVRGRNELARLDLRSLVDIGMTPAERDFLVKKPFWRE